MAEEHDDPLIQFHQVPIKPNRISALKKQWSRIIQEVTGCGLDIRFNFYQKAVELKTNAMTENPQIIQQAAEFIRAIDLGFQADDAATFLKFDDLQLDYFDATDVKLSLKNDGLERAMGRIFGQSGKVKNTIENATKTRIVCMGKNVCILGTPACVRAARGAVCDLILGSDAGKVYQRLAVVKDRFE